MFASAHTEWWLVSLRGLVVALIGVLALALPTQTVTAILVIVAVLILVNSLFSLVAASRRHDPAWGPGIFEGVLGVVVGVLAVAMPRLTAMVLAVLVGVWALITGAIEIMAAVQLQREGASPWLPAVTGALSVLFGIAVIIAPSVGVVFFAVVVGIYALIFGISLMVFGLRLRHVS